MVKRILIIACMGITPIIAHAQVKEKLDTTKIELTTFENETLNNISEAKNKLSEQFKRLEEAETLAVQLIADHNKIMIDKIKGVAQNGKTLVVISSK